MAEAMKQQLDLFGAEVLDLQAFASSESTRYALSGIHLEPGRAVASNGKMMLIVPSVTTDEWPGEMTEGLKPLPKEGIIVPVAALKKAFAFVDRKSKIEVLRGVIAGVGPKDSDKGLATLVGTDLETSGTVKARVIEGSFPAVDDVLPDEKARPYKVVISASLLKSIVAYASKHANVKRLCAMRFSFDPKDRDASVRIDFMLPDGRKVTGVIMPIKGGAWCETAPEKKEEPKPAEPVAVVEKKQDVVHEAVDAAIAAVVETPPAAATKKARKGKKEAA